MLKSLLIYRGIFNTTTMYTLTKDNVLRYTKRPRPTHQPPLKNRRMAKRIPLEISVIERAIHRVASYKSISIGVLRTPTYSSKLAIRRIIILLLHIPYGIFNLEWPTALLAGCLTKISTLKLPMSGTSVISSIGNKLAIVYLNIQTWGRTYNNTTYTPDIYNNTTTSYNNTTLNWKAGGWEGKLDFIFLYILRSQLRVKF